MDPELLRSILSNYTAREQITRNAAGTPYGRAVATAQEMGIGDGPSAREVFVDPVANAAGGVRDWASANIPPALAAALATAQAGVNRADSWGLPASEVVDFGRNAFDYVSQSPLLDTLVTGTGRYLGELATGTPEGAAIRRGIREGASYLGDNFMDYLVPGGERPDNQSWGDILDMTPTQAFWSDLATSSIEFSPFLFRGGRNLLTARGPAPTMTLGENLENIVQQVTSWDANRIRNLPGLTDNPAYRFSSGSLADLPADVIDSVVAGMSPAVRDGFANSPHAKQYLNNLMQTVESAAFRMADNADDFEAFTKSRSALERYLNRDFGVPPPIARQIALEAGGRARRVSSARANSLIHRFNLATGGPTRYSTQVNPYIRGNLTEVAIQRLDDLGFTDLADNLRNAPLSRQEEMLQEALIEAQARVRYANEVPDDVDWLMGQPNMSAEEYRRAFPDMEPPTGDYTWGTGSGNSLIPYDATDEEAQFIFDVIADEGRLASEPGNAGALGVDDADDLLRDMRTADGQFTINSADDVPLLDEPLRSAVDELEQITGNMSDKVVNFMNRYPILDTEGADRFLGRLTQSDYYDRYPGIDDFLSKYTAATSELNPTDVVIDLMEYDVSAQDAADILRRFWNE